MGRPRLSAGSDKKAACADSVSPQLRRSKRKSTLGSVVISPVTAKKARKSKEDKFSVLASAALALPPPPTLLSLPLDIHEKFLQYLDVKSQEALSSTCSYFDQMIRGRHLMRVDIPFSREFLSELKAAQTIEKKPLLRLECKVLSASHMFDDSGFLAQEYILESQMNLLSLSKLREVNLVPDDIQTRINIRNTSMWECAKDFDHIILSRLSRVGVLNNISRLDIVLGMEELAHLLWKDILPGLTNLVELHLVVLERRACAGQREEYIYGILEEIVKAVKCPRLKLTVLSENKRIRKIPKVLSSDHIEYLRVSAPCTLNLSLNMKNLKKLKLDLPKPRIVGDCCTYQGSKLSDRKLHRVGLCIVHIGSLYSHCKNLVNFNGIKIGRTKKTKINKWHAKMTDLFYEDYVNSGGTKSLKEWTRKRWFTKLPSHPVIYGKARLPLCLQ